MGPKKNSPVKDAKVGKKAAPKKTATKTPTKKASTSADGLKYVRAKSFSKSDKDAQDFSTYTVKLYLESSDEPIAEFEGAMPDSKDVFWCSGTGPVFHLEVSCMAKDGHKFVCDY